MGYWRINIERRHLKGEISSLKVNDSLMTKVLVVSLDKRGTKFFENLWDGVLMAERMCRK